MAFEIIFQKSPLDQRNQKEVRDSRDFISENSNIFLVLK